MQILKNNDDENMCFAILFLVLLMRMMSVKNIVLENCRHEQHADAFPIVTCLKTKSLPFANADVIGH